MEADVKLQLDLVDIVGKEIAMPGVYTAKTGKVEIKESDLDDMVKHFDNGEYSPYLNLDHNDKFTEKVKESLKVLRLGTANKLYKVGKKLVADFTKVPAKVAEFINEGLMDLRSIEFSKNFNGKDDKLLHNVLKAVSFFGADVPAIAGLGDHIPSLLEQRDDEDIVVNLKQEVKNMAKIELEKNDYDVLLKASVQVEKLQMDITSKDETIELLKSDNETLKTENKDFKDTKEEVEKLKADIDADKEAALKLEADTYIDKVIADTKLLPKFKEMKVAEYIRLKADDSALTLFKEELEGKSDVVNLKPILPNTVDGEVKLQKLTFDSEEDVELNAGKYMEDTEAVIQATMKAKNMTWAEAAVDCKAIRPEDLGQPSHVEVMKGVK